MYNDIMMFTDKLASAEPLHYVTNQYSFEVEDNRVRRNNSLIYLTPIRKINPNIIFVGEAPGFHGYRCTGVSFTSEHILLKDDTFFGKSRRYEYALLTYGLQKSISVPLQPFK